MAERPNYGNSPVFLKQTFADNFSNILSRAWESHSYCTGFFYAREFIFTGPGKNRNREVKIRYNILSENTNGVGRDNTAWLISN